MKHCRSCSQHFKPTAYQIKKHDYRCLPCRRRADRQWRAERKAIGNPVISSKLPRAWHQQYEKEYYADPENRKRVAANMRRYSHDPSLRHKHEARWILNKAVKFGRIKPQQCADCGHHKTQAHHEDYSKPLDVIWLCRQCHDSRHARAEGQRPTTDVG